jgi:hypothetical protein
MCDMTNFRTLALGLALCACAAFAERAEVQRVDLYGPNGTVHGKVIMLDDRLVFVDNGDPNMSVSLPRTDISRARMEGGRLTIEVTRPYSSPFGQNQSDLVLLMPDESSAGLVITWMGVPVAGYSGEAQRSTPQEAMPQSTPGRDIKEVSFDVRNGDQHGKLIFHRDSVSFESLSDARHSRHWTYAEVRELNRKGNEMEIEPYHGDKYKFQFIDPAMRDTVYNMLSDRIVAAREGHH